MNFETTAKNLRAAGFSVQVFDSGAEAAEWLNQQIDGKTVGIGGSATVKQLGLYDLLKTHNTVFWHWEQEQDEARLNAMKTDVYLSSANALAQTGEIVNIDGKGNRVASTLFGHQKVYFLIGQNKLTGTYDEAVWRARNVAAPRRAAQFNVKTPCVASGAERCFNCKSPERVCRAMVTLWGPMMGSEAEVLLIREDLGL
ncbi:MAG: lactate utilization protein [Oscillospiraceae bacterium]|nr:lactate utilization protein [Oscillospiraceae bacterium]